MKALDTTTSNKINGNFKNGEKVIAVSSLSKDGKVVVFEIEKKRGTKFVYMQYIMKFYETKKQRIFNNTFFFEKDTDFLSEIVMHMRAFEKDYDVVFSFFVLMAYETIPILSGDGMNLECVVRTLFEDGFFPNKYFELEGAK